jgi:hypothetical protein
MIAPSGVLGNGISRTACAAGSQLAGSTAPADRSAIPTRNGKSFCSDLISSSGRRDQIAYVDGTYQDDGGDEIEGEIANAVDTAFGFERDLQKL